MSVAIAGCGTSAGGPGTEYCPPSARCAKVHVVVEQCGGMAPGRCLVVPFDSIKVFDAQGKPAGDAGANAATGHKLRSALFFEPPGRYVFERTVDGHQITRTVTLRASHTYSLKLTEQIP